MEAVWEFIKGLKTEQIALLSIVVSLLIYTLGKHNELRMKKHEAKKEQYIKLMKFIEKVFEETKNGVKESEISQSDFFDMGASLLLYGSRKVYKQYIFFRGLSGNPLVEQSKYFSNNTLIYVLADLFKTIRKEVGLNLFDSISESESLAFFVNNMANNPISKVNAYKAKYNIRMLKLELICIDLYSFVIMKKLFYNIVMPIFGIIKMILKYAIIIPLGRIIKLWPNANTQLTELQARLSQIKEGS